MTENEIAKEIVDACYHIHSQLGPGLLETAYEIILYHELTSRKLKVERQVSVPIRWKKIVIDNSFRADLIVEN